MAHHLYSYRAKYVAYHDQYVGSMKNIRSHFRLGSNYHYY